MTIPLTTQTIWLIAALVFCFAFDLLMIADYIERRVREDARYALLKKAGSRRSSAPRKMGPVFFYGRDS